VGPGFEYEDFTLLADEPNLRGMIIQKFPGLAGLL
jgi:predicted cupin superfamily sugar epimerase